MNLLEQLWEGLKVNTRHDPVYREIVSRPTMDVVEKWYGDSAKDKAQRRRDTTKASTIGGAIGGWFGQPWVGPAIAAVAGNEEDMNYKDVGRNAAYGLGAGYAGMAGRAAYGAYGAGAKAAAAESAPAASTSSAPAWRTWAKMGASQAGQQQQPQQQAMPAQAPNQQAPAGWPDWVRDQQDYDEGHAFGNYVAGLMFAPQPVSGRKG